MMLFYNKAINILKVELPKILLIAALRAIMIQFIDDIFIFILGLASIANSFLVSEILYLLTA